MDKGSALDYFYFPVTSPAEAYSTLDTWISADGGRWSNDQVNRANTLTVRALLSPGPGVKTIKIWFAESTGASNVSGLMRCEEAVIELVEGTPTNTPTNTATYSPTATPSNTPIPTPSNTSTPTPTPSPSPTFTPTPTNMAASSPTSTPSNTPSSTPTFTPTPTNMAASSLTSTPSNTPSSTPTFTPIPTNTAASSPTSTPSNTPSSTPTPTHTLIVIGTSSETPTITQTYTISPTSSITPTDTISPTITLTPTISPTLPPTPTFTPCVVFYLDKNRFTPGRESLKIRVGMIKEDEFKVTIFTLAGRRVWQTRPGSFNDGYYRLEWDGRNQEGQDAASGVYFVVLESHGRREIRKVLLIK